MTADSPARRGPKLRIVAVNDVYTLENLPRLRTLVRRVGEASPADATIVTLAGDFLAPSLLSSVDAGRGMVDCLNAVGVTHVTFGNHEDDVPTAELARRERELRAVWLGTNVVGAPPVIAREAFVDVAAPGGRAVRVALVGVVMNDPTIYRRVPFGSAAVEPANAVALAATKRLLAEGSDAVIPLTHQDAPDDRALARRQRDPPYAVIVGGHEHAAILEEIDGTWLVKAGADATHAAIVDVVFSPDPPANGAHDRPTVTVRLEDVARYDEDPDVRARVDARMRIVRELQAATLVTLAPGESLSSIGTRSRQTTFGALLASRIRDALGAEACLLNGGGIRGARTYDRHVTYGDIEAEVPFANEIVVVPMPASVVAEAIATSRRSESGGFLQVDDRTIVDDGGVTRSIAGAPLTADRVVRVALVRELFLGLDHVEPLVRFAREHPAAIPPPGSGRDVKLVLVDAFSRALWRKLGGFDAVDANHDGSIDEPEIAAAVARVTHEDPSLVTAGLVLRALDANHDRRVSREEADAIGEDEPAER